VERKRYLKKKNGKKQISGDKERRKEREKETEKET